MTVGVLTNIVLAIAAAGTLTYSIYYNRSRSRQAAAAAEQREDERRVESGEVNLKNINTAIGRERDRLQAQLDRSTEQHAKQIDDLRREHNREISALRDRWETDAAEMRRGLDREAAEMKQRYDSEMSTLATRLAECQRDLASCQQAQLELHQKLWEMQKLLPPNARPGSPPIT